MGQSNEKDMFVAANSQTDADVSTGDVTTVKGARDARAVEHNISLKDAFTAYRPAIGWAFLFSLGVIMAGFDPQLVGTLIAIPRFQHDFGVELPDGSSVRFPWDGRCRNSVDAGLSRDAAS
jgi:SP family general alpha glucoside:H+ symporter-like MFS transporter